MDKKIGKRIKDARLNKGLTLREVGDLVGSSESTFSRYESGDVENIPIIKIQAIAEVLNVTPTYLMGWEHNERMEEIKSRKYFHRIKDLRIEMGLSQSELAEKTGYKDRTSIAKIEAGKVDLPQSKIIELAKALNITPAHLMGWEYQEKRRTNMQEVSKVETVNSKFLSAKEVASILDVSETSAYRIIKKLNQELNEQGKLTIAGKISRRYFEEKVYL